MPSAASARASPNIRNIVKMPYKKACSLWDIYSSGLELAATSLRAGETLLAANAVIGSRVGTMRAAAHNPLTANYAELALMLPEKVEAFSRAGASLMKDAESVQAETGAQIRHVTSIMTSGKIPTMSDMFTLTARWASITQKMTGAAGRALLPVHAAATRNATRLRKK
jgi:hypothetical protein